jgi:hypothetical protein
MGIVHSTDAERQYGYDQQSTEKVLDEEGERGWAFADMKRH